MANDKKDVLYALQTSRGIVTFDDPSELQPWLDKGMNRFDLLGTPKLEEIEVETVVPEPKQVGITVGVNWKDKTIMFFDLVQDAKSWAAKSPKYREIETYTTEVM